MYCNKRLPKVFLEEKGGWSLLYFFRAVQEQEPGRDPGAEQQDPGLERRDPELRPQFSRQSNTCKCFIIV